MSTERMNLEPIMKGNLKLSWFVSKGVYQHLTEEEVSYLLNNRTKVVYVGRNNNDLGFKIENDSNKYVGKLIILSGVNELFERIGFTGDFSVLTEHDVRILDMLRAIKLCEENEHNCGTCGRKAIVWADMSIGGSRWSYLCYKDYIEGLCTLGKDNGKLLLPENHEYADLVDDTLDGWGL